MDIENLFTYGLLLYHGLNEDKAKKMEVAIESFKHLNVRTFHGKYIDEFYKTGWPDINTFIENPKHMIDYARYYINELEAWFDFGDIEVKDFIKIIEPDIDSYGISWGLISDTIKKTLIQKWLYLSIVSAYKDLPVKVKELQFCSEKFNGALLRDKDSESMSTKSKSNVEDMRKFFNLQLKKYLPVYKEVFEYLPLKIFKDIPKLTPKQVQLYFKNQLANKLKQLLQHNKINSYNRDIIIGYYLSIAGYCKDYKRFIKDDNFETVNTASEKYAFIDEYKRHLRDCARYSLK